MSRQKTTQQAGLPVRPCCHGDGLVGLANVDARLCAVSSRDIFVAAFVSPLSLSPAGALGSGTCAWRCRAARSGTEDEATFAPLFASTLVDTAAGS